MHYKTKIKLMAQILALLSDLEGLKYGLKNLILLILMSFHSIGCKIVGAKTSNDSNKSQFAYFPSDNFYSQNQA